jgi:hypothetical protein
MEGHKGKNRSARTGVERALENCLQVEHFNIIMRYSGEEKRLRDPEAANRRRMVEDKRGTLGRLKLAVGE